MQHRSVTIACPAFGRPPPKVTWLKVGNPTIVIFQAGRPLDDTLEVKTSANGQKLYILDFQESLADRYTCVAKNPAGEDKRDFRLRLLS